MNVPLLLESEGKRIEAIDYLERLSSVDEIRSWQTKTNMRLSEDRPSTPEAVARRSVGPDRAPDSEVFVGHQLHT
jgi:hypothetical protein